MALAAEEERLVAVRAGDAHRTLYLSPRYMSIRFSDRRFQQCDLRDKFRLD